MYFWVDGVYLATRLEEARHCIVVIMGATPEGQKELGGLWDGYRESEQSWKALLLDPKAAGSRWPQLGHWRWRVGGLASAAPRVRPDALATVVGA